MTESEVEEARGQMDRAQYDENYLRRPLTTALEYLELLREALIEEHLPMGGDHDPSTCKTCRLIAGRSS